MEVIRKKDGFASEKIFVLPESMVEELAKHELTRSLYITDIGYFPHAKYHYRERNEGCDSHIFIYCVEGEGWVDLEREKRITLKEHQLIVIPANTPHRYGASEQNPWSIYWFHLKGEHVPLFVLNFQGDSDSISIPYSGHLQLVEGFQQCYDLLVDKTYSLRHHIHASQTMRQLLSFLSLLAGGSPQEIKREQDIERAVRFMTEHLHQSVSLSTLAQYTGFSKQHLTYLFKRFTGYPPIDYFLRLKMQRASQLLHLTDLTVKEIGVTLGMNDPYYFSRCFKKVYGLSPTQFRKVQKG